MYNDIKLIVMLHLHWAGVPATCSPRRSRLLQHTTSPLSTDTTTTTATPPPPAETIGRKRAMKVTIALLTIPPPCPSFHTGDSYSSCTFAIIMAHCLPLGKSGSKGDRVALGAR